MQSYMLRFQQMNKTGVCLPSWPSQNATDYSNCFNTNDTDCYGNCKMYNTTKYDKQPCFPPAGTAPPMCGSVASYWRDDQCRWECPAGSMKCASVDRWSTSYDATNDNCMNVHSGDNCKNLQGTCDWVPVDETRPAPPTFLTESFCHPQPTAGTNMTESDWYTCIFNSEADCGNTGG